MNAIKQRLNDSAAMRWSMLILIAVITFATYYVNDIFSGMKGIMELQLGITSSDYGLLLSAVGYFNIIGMIVVGGIILDKWGIRKTGFLFVGIATMGSLLISYGGSAGFVNGGLGYDFLNSFLKQFSPQLKMMFIGRLLFGLGLETCCVLVQKVIVKWFKNKELALAFAINMGVGRFGSAFAIMLAPEIAGELVNGMYPNFPTVLFVGFALSVVAFLLFIVYTSFDVKIDRELAAEEAKNRKKESEEKAVTKEQATGRAGETGFLPWLKSTSVYMLLTNKSFLFIAALCVTFYSAVFPFIGYATDMLVNKFGFDTKLASKITGFIPIGTIIFTPIFGRLVDKKGKSASLMIVGSLLLIFAHLTLSLTMITPYIALLALGVAFSLVPAAMWPSVAKIVEEKRLGVAYAMMFTIQNWGLTAFFYLIGKVLEVTNPDVTAELIRAGEKTYNYTTTILMLAFLGILGIIFALLLKREDKVSGFGLELPSGVKES